MRNLKRVLALAMALVMILGMMVIGSSAASYSDAAAIDEDYAEAVEVLTGLGVFKGNGAGFAPKAILTRAEAAALIYRVISADVKDSKIDLYSYSNFADVKADAWYTGYVTYAANGGYIKGYDGNFMPDEQVTGVQVLAIMLRAMGYGQKGEFEGAAWKDGVLTVADDLNLLDNVNVKSLDDPASRELVAQLIFDAILAPTTVYTPAFGYVFTDNMYAGNASLAVKNFNLAKVEAVITDTDADYGTTTIGTKVLKGTDADWTKVGYAARGWYNTKTSKAVAIIVTGKALSVTTNGTSIAALTNKKLPTYVASIVPAYAQYNNGQAGAVTPAIGTKVALVDNNNDGVVDTVVGTEYTAALVTGVLKTSYTGTIADYSYSYADLTNGTTGTIFADELANVAALTKDSFITFVKVDGYYYITDTAATMGEFQSITRATIGATVAKAYAVAGNTYVASDRTVDTNYNVALASANLTKDVIVVTDEYGYVIYAALYTDPAAYLLVMSNEDTHGIKNLAETSVVYPDGSVAEILTAWKADIADDELAKRDNGKYGEIYAYTTNKAGNIELDETTVDYYKKATYVAHSVAFGGVELTPYTTFVDLRDVIKGKAASGTVYTGYNALPGITEAEIVYVTNQAGKMSLAYIIGGTNTEDLKASFVVFNTNINVETAYKVGQGLVPTYTLEAGVLIKGQVVPNYELTKTQYEEIVKNGAGAYTFGSDGKLAKNGFVPFTADTITWTPENSGTLVDGGIDVTDTYTTVFVNLTKGQVNYWYQFVLEGDYYCIIDDSVKSNVIAYVVTDATAPETELAAAQKAAKAAVYGWIVDYSEETLGVTAEELSETLAEVIAAIDAAKTPAAAKAIADGKVPYATGTGIVELNTKALEIQAEKAAAAKANDNFVVVVKDADIVTSTKTGATVAVTDQAAAIKAALTEAGYTDIEIEIENGAIKSASAKNGGISVTFRINAASATVAAAADSAALAAALTDTTVDTIYLAAGEYTANLYEIASKDSLTIVGDGTTKIAFSNLQVRASQFEELVIENCIIERMPDKKWGHLVFGSSTTAGGVYTISNCTFNGVGSQGVYINQDVAATFNFENCTFNGNFGSEGAITVQNNDGVDITVNVTDCAFNNIPATSHEIFVHYAYDGWTLNADGVDAYWAANP